MLPCVGFVLTEETTVSVGLLVNMSGQSCMALQRFSLTQGQVTVHEKASDAVPSIAKLSNDRLYYISLPYRMGGLASWAVEAYSCSDSSSWRVWFASLSGR